MITETNEIKFDLKHGVLRHRLPCDLISDKDVFNRLWALHPLDFPSIFLHGRNVSLPRWQQAYGRSYLFSGQYSKAKPMPEILLPYLNWAREKVDQRLNGLLLNWYDGQVGHYIGAHRDSTRGLVADGLITMISLGGSRIMRFRPVNQSGYIDLEIDNGDVIILPMSTNSNYKHEVPRFKRHQDKRISITLRCFQ